LARIRRAIWWPLALYASLGFVTEGVWRESWQRPTGEWVDCTFLGMLAREWRGPGAAALAGGATAS
jgi:hypothetical protein